MHTLREPVIRQRGRRVVLALLLTLTVLALGLGRTSAEAPRVGTSKALDHPLVGRAWGVFKGNMDSVWQPYSQSSGTRRAQLAKIALTPRSVWFTPRMDMGRIRKLVRFYIDNAQAGDPEALVQMAIFAIRPWEGEACKRLPTQDERAAYKAWIDVVADEIGDAHVLLIVQPDAPFALCSPNPGVPLALMHYAVEKFTAQPHTTVYIEAGAADWLKDDVDRALKILVPAGVDLARGFAFNSTHYDSTARQIRFGARVAQALEAQGISGKKFVINTAENGKPFKGYTYRGSNYNNARLCVDQSDTRCVTLGIPPTTDVGNPQWGLAETDAALAVQYVDAYLWIGRPWNYNQASPFVMKRALSVVRTSPYTSYLPARPTG